MQQAADYGYKAVVKVLIDAGIDQSLKDKDGKTAE